jgi:hypothetical protein
MFLVHYMDEEQFELQNVYLAYYYMITDMGKELTLKKRCSLIFCTPRFPCPNRSDGFFFKSFLTKSAASCERQFGYVGS